ncbi:DinB family protein [Peribacillus glennii]|uniref:DinB family protein n=1 Tax=Peribacillus glennii TaxID=2303991 RepID=A0A372L9C5_9BACI|nr:DinB family protein [Peribacillus glennii]RFU62097.1 DinB family protein [Peribacillus glennii]
MSELIFKQFDLTRSNFLKELNGLNPEIIDIQPQGFNNTIHWHIGHVLTSTEQFMFGFPNKSSNIPENYIALFGYGTKPADWQGDVPSLEQLTEQLKEQAARLKEIPASSLQQELKKPFLGLSTFGELANMAVYHEAYHLGQIHAMARVINK